MILRDATQAHWAGDKVLATCVMSSAKKYPNMFSLQPGVRQNSEIQDCTLPEDRDHALLILLS